MNLYVSGESLKCYICSSAGSNKCADPIDKSGLETVECGLNIPSVPGIGLEVPKVEFSCLKSVVSGKKFQSIVISETFIRIWN
jgi:hypothetical protein